jgi:hypothetical protein
MTTLATVHLDVCTPEGKTWCARVTGHDTDQPGGLAREFLTAAEANLSRSGMTGTKTYELTDGVYETNEGRRSIHPNRKFWIVTDGRAQQVDRTAALAALGVTR